MKIRSNGKKAAAPGSASQRRLKCRLAAAVLLLAISAALMALAAKQPGFAEWYSENVYSLFVNSLGRLWGLFPFSVSEMALYILAAVFLLSLAAAVRKGIHGAVPWLSCILLAAGILAFLYTICCGINYHRKSFSEEEGIITYRYTAQDLKEVCLWLTHFPGKWNVTAAE